MNESDVDFTALIFDPDGFLQHVADEMGLDSTEPLAMTCLGGTMYRVDFSVGKHHAYAAVPYLGAEQVRYTANGFATCIRKWHKQEEQQNWDSSFKQLPHPNTWGKFAELVDEYMQLPKGRVEYKEEIVTKIVEVPPTILESISDLLRGYWPRRRKAIVDDGKLAIIKVVDEDGTTIVHTAFDADALATFDGAKVVEVGQKLKRAMDTQIGNKKKD